METRLSDGTNWKLQLNRIKTALVFHPQQEHSALITVIYKIHLRAYKEDEIIIICFRRAKIVFLSTWRDPCWEPHDNPLPPGLRWRRQKFRFCFHRKPLVRSDQRPSRVQIDLFVFSNSLLTWHVEKRKNLTLLGATLRSFWKFFYICSKVRFLTSLPDFA